MFNFYTSRGRVFTIVFAGLIVFAAWLLYNQPEGGTGRADYYSPPKSVNK